jgi:hypothetical protein
MSAVVSYRTIAQDVVIKRGAECGGRWVSGKAVSAREDLLPSDPDGGPTALIPFWDRDNVDPRWGMHMPLA